MQLPKPIFKPNEVKGFLGHKEAEKPDRVFNVLEKNAVADRVWEIDGYLRKEKDGQEYWMLLLVCPHCAARGADAQKVLRIDSVKKAIEISPDGLRVEPFRCTWPGDFGSLICSFQHAIEPPTAGDRLVICQDGVKRQIDGVFRRA